MERVRSVIIHFFNSVCFGKAAGRTQLLMCRMAENNRCTQMLKAYKSHNHFVRAYENLPIDRNIVEL